MAIRVAPLLRAGPHPGDGVLSVDEVEGRLLARLSWVGLRPSKDWWRVVDADGTELQQGGAGGHGQGDERLVGHTFLTTPAIGSDLMLVTDTNRDVIQFASGAGISAVNIAGDHRWLIDQYHCFGCNGEPERSKRHCPSCRAAIEAASHAGRDIGPRLPRRILPLCVHVGVVAGWPVALIAIEDYQQLWILRSWWGIKAAPDRDLSTLRSPLDRRIEAIDNQGLRYVSSPGSGWGTDGDGVYVDHRFTPGLSPAIAALHLTIIDGSQPVDPLLDLHVDLTS